MKKYLFVAAMLLFVSSNFAFAMSPQEQREAHRQEMKAVKEAQRQNKAKVVAAAPSGPSFWQKEGERSGLSQTGEKIGGFFGRFTSPATFFKNQQEAYNARKAAVKA